MPILYESKQNYFDIATLILIKLTIYLFILITPNIFQLIQTRYSITNQGGLSPGAFIFVIISKRNKYLKNVTHHPI